MYFNKFQSFLVSHTNWQATAIMEECIWRCIILGWLLSNHASRYLVYLSIMAVVCQIIWPTEKLSFNQLIAGSNPTHSFLFLTFFSFDLSKINDSLPSNSNMIYWISPAKPQKTRKIKMNLNTTAICKSQPIIYNLGFSTVCYWVNLFQAFAAL